MEITMAKLCGDPRVLFSCTMSPTSRLPDYILKYHKMHTNGKILHLHPNHQIQLVRYKQRENTKKNPPFSMYSASTFETRAGTQYSPS